MDFSEITPDLLIGTTPSAADYDRLRSLGVRLVINMRFTRPPYADPHPTPLDFLWLPSVDTMFFPIPVFTLTRGVRAALTTIESGGRVYAHCAGGVHRSVAMGASILIAQGHEAESAMELIKSRRSFADPDIFYIRRQILKFAREWRIESRE
jgi:protein tyrosine phosphatase (PTP) superfamily phosphohydrolase (DUF442 family)